MKKKLKVIKCKDCFKKGRAPKTNIAVQGVIKSPLHSHLERLENGYAEAVE